MFRKNVSGQTLYFALVNATTGAALTGATVTGKRSIDGAAQGSVTGTISEDAGGQYHLALSQADINGNDIGFLFTATNAIPVNITVVTTAADPTDAVRLGLTALPNANAEAAGGLYTRGSGPGQINQPASGQIDANAVKLGGTVQTGRDVGASVLLSAGSGAGQLDFTSGVVKANLAQILGTALTETAGQIAAAFKKLFDVAAPVLTATSVNQTGDAYGRVGAAGAGLTALGDARIAHLDADTSSRLAPTVAGRTLDVAATGEAGLDFDNIHDASGAHTLTNITVPVATAVTNDVGITQAGADKAWSTAARSLTDKAGFALSAAGVQAIWDALTSALTTVGSVGKRIADNLDIAVSSRGDATAANQTTILNRLGAFTGSGLNTILGFLRALLRKDAALTPSDVGGTYDNTSMSLEAVRGDYTTARAVKIDHLDADVSSRSTYAGADTGGTTTLLGRIPGTVQPQTGDAYARLGTPVLATLSLDIAEIAAETDLVAAVKAKTDNLPASPAAVGSAMALTTSERSSVADALLDRADAVEVGLTPRQAMRLIAAAVAGKLAGAGTTTITIRNAVQDSKARITATVDAQGDRSAITWDVS